MTVAEKVRNKRLTETHKEQANEGLHCSAEELIGDHWLGKVVREDRADLRIERG